MNGYPQYAAYILGAQSTAIAEIQTNVNAVKNDVAAVKTDVATVNGKVKDTAVKKPRVALFKIATTVANTWYTVIDITGYEGYLNRVIAQVVAGQIYAEVEITIDGVANVLQGLSGISYVNSETDTGIVTSYEGDRYFSTGLKVRIRSTNGTQAQEAHVDYSIV